MGTVEIPLCAGKIGFTVVFCDTKRGTGAYHDAFNLKSVVDHEALEPASGTVVARLSLSHHGGELLGGGFAGQ